MKRKGTETGNVTCGSLFAASTLKRTKTHKDTDNFLVTGDNWLNTH
jgi:hypothetical protein